LKVISDTEGKKIGIFGKLQGNTPMHDQIVMQRAEELAATGRYKYITVNRGWRYATGEGSSKRPDIIGVRNDTKVDAWEVESPTDNPYILQAKLTGPEGMQGIPEARRGIAGVLRPHALDKHANAINDMKRRGQDVMNPPVIIVLPSQKKDESAKSCTTRLLSKPIIQKGRCDQFGKGERTVQLPSY
jgi:hypothetical protein